ncbi:MAG: hypothetical protein JHC88_17035, partial [Niveispirillum sp.]|nr:hypothetical protein [Niveispirillum sp.]
TWLREEGSSSEDLPPPETLAAEIIDQLRTALEEMEELAALLEPESVGAGV